VTHPPRVRHLGQPFSLQSFFFPNDLFFGWFSCYLMNYYFRSLIPSLVSYPYPSHWSTTRAAVQSSHVIGRVLVHLLPTISTHFRLRSFVRIVRLIRLFFLFFPNRLGRFDSPFFPHKFCCVWNFNIFRLRDLFFPFSLVILSLPIPPLTASFTVFVIQIYLPFFSPAVDGITLSFLLPLLACYRLD
jgi:hypothetical protein